MFSVPSGTSIHRANLLLRRHGYQQAGHEADAMTVAEGSAVDQKAQVRGFLKLGRSIAREAASLPANQRRAFIRQEVTDLQQMYRPVQMTKTFSPGRELLDSMEGWVTRLVNILDKDV